MAKISKINSAIDMVLNASRRLELMYNGYFQTDEKHKHYADYGYPQHLQAEHFLQMYHRNGIAHAAVAETVGTTWQDNPTLQEDDRTDEETSREKEVRQHLARIRFWQCLSEADTRSLVGKYAGVILRIADSKPFDQPVEQAAGIEALVEVIPVWEHQLKVAELDGDPASETYGKPTMFEFHEAPLDGKAGAGRTFKVHPDRVVIWSENGTTNGESILRPGYNSLINLEKIEGAGGEGFWKNAKSAPVLQVDKDAQLRDLAAAMGVPEDEIADKLDEVVGDFQKGFDNLLMLQGIEAKQLAVTLPQPEQFYLTSLQSFAASIRIPVKILVGSQTGERASTEDATAWAKVVQSRRVKETIPNIEAVVERLRRFKILSDADWVVSWSDLTESTLGDKIERADKMASVNQKHAHFGRVVFQPDEIRDVVDLPALNDGFGDEDDQDVADALKELEEEETQP
jgi:hypothetical protein